MFGSDIDRGAAASAGGARAASGLAFQAEVFAWWATRAVAGVTPGFGLGPFVTVEAVGCETGFPVDDVGVALCGGGFILVQAKGGMRRLDARAADFRAALDQVVNAMTGGLRAGVDLRPVDVSRDRLVIATNQDSSQSFDALGEVCARLRDHPASMPLISAATNNAQRRALATFITLVEASWAAASGDEPTEDELRRFLRVVEVSRLDFEADIGSDLVRCETMLEHALVIQPFSTLVRLGIEVAHTRTWRQRHALMTALGLPSPEDETGPTDIDRLKELTRRTLDRLDVHRLLSTPDGDIRVSRQIVGVLRSESDSFLITGLPGAGKSGVVADLADTLPGDTVVLAVDAVPMDRALAQLRWNLTADLADVLRAWEGTEPATLMLDGIDAHRSGASWLADLVEELHGTRWRVIASIRRFELSHSRRWQQLFRGSPVAPATPAGPALSQVRHVVIPNFDEDELAVVAGSSGSLGALVTAGDDRLRDLLANPFNLSLAADLVGQVPIAQLATLHTQVQILATYWQVRVHDGPGGYARSDAVRHLVEQMTVARSLEIAPSGSGALDVEAVEQMVSCGVLEEVEDRRLVALTQPVRFRHHIVFDFALAASLRGQRGSELSHVLAADPDFVLFGRPAIDFHLADLWSAEDNRRSFWRTAVTLADTGSPLAVAAATATAVHQIEFATDVHILVTEATERPAPGATVVNQLASALSAAGEVMRARIVANIAAYDELLGALGAVWLECTEPHSTQALVRLIWELDSLSPLPRSGTAAQAHAATIVRLLKLALNDPGSNSWLGEHALRFIVGAAPIDHRALPLLLKCLDAEVTAAWGLLHLRPVLNKLSDIAMVDATVAGRLAAAPFLFDASEKRTVSIGSSQIVGLHESWLQAHEGLRYIVIHKSWTAFEAVTPLAAMETLIVILNHFTSNSEGTTPVSWNGVAGRVGGFSWSLDLSNSDDLSDLVNATVAAMTSRATTGGNNDEILRIWAAHITHSDAWHKLLQAGADEPRLGVQLRSALLETGGLFVDLGTRPAAIHLAATLSPLISDDEHTQLEQVAINLPASEPEEDLRHFLERARDQILVVLDRGRVQTDAAKARLEEIVRTGDEPCPPERMVPLARWEPISDEERWRLWGIDPAAVSEAMRTTLASGESALAQDVSETDRWSALVTTVATERKLARESALRPRFRYLVGRLVTSVLVSERLTPDDIVGTWIADLLVALADDSPLPSVPEAMC